MKHCYQLVHHLRDLDLSRWIQWLWKEKKKKEKITGSVALFPGLFVENIFKEVIVSSVIAQQWKLQVQTYESFMQYSDHLRRMRKLKFFNPSQSKSMRIPWWPTYLWPVDSYMAEEVLNSEAQVQLYLLNHFKKAWYHHRQKEKNKTLSAPVPQHLL